MMKRRERSSPAFSASHEPFEARHTEDPPKLALKGAPRSVSADDSEVATVAPDPDLAIIDDLGVKAVADALEISREAVRKWRVKETIPDHRRQELRDLAADMNDSCSDGQPGLPTLPTRLTAVVGQAPTVQSEKLVDLDAITGFHAVAKVDAAIAERDAHLAGRRSLALSATADGDSENVPLHGYGFRLAVLFAMDFPVLTMAFVTVAQVSPIVAAGSAIALSLFLVLGGHLLGGVLRAASRSIPIWCRHLTSACLLIALLTAIVWVTVDLRLKGLELEDAGTASSNALVFGDPDEATAQISPAFKLAIGQAAALVTAGSLIFGIAWSYREHGPASARAKAEHAYRRHLRRLARKRVRVAKLEGRIAKGTTTAAIVLATIMSFGRPSAAMPCDGPTVLALVDITTAYDDVDRRQIMPAIEHMAQSLEAGQRLTMRTVRDTANASRLLFDDCTPVSDPEVSWSVGGIWSWLTANPSDKRAESEAFFTGVRDALLPLLQSHGEASRTALIGTLARLVDSTDRLHAIWLFSDLLESSMIDADALLNGKSDVLLQAKDDVVMALGDVDIHVAGFGRFHDQGRRELTENEQASLLDNWTTLIQRSGGRLHIEQAHKGGNAQKPEAFDHPG